MCIIVVILNWSELICFYMILFCSCVIESKVFFVIVFFVDGKVFSLSFRNGDLLWDEFLV